MATAKLRVGGAWVDTTLTGTVRVAGVSVPFGPGGGPAYEAIAWSNPVPDLVDADDVSTRYNLGVKFTLTTGKPCYGVQWRAPTNTPSPTQPGFVVGHSASLWDLDENQLEKIDFTPTPGVYQDILFTTPYALVGGTEYIVSVYTFHYTFRAGQFPAASPSGNIAAPNGRLVADQGPDAFPSGTSTGCFYVSPLVGV